MTQNQFDKKSEAWSALFSEPMSELVKRYTASVFFDKRLWLADITGSLAHAEMLAAQGIIGLWTHQAECWEVSRQGQHFIVTTGTASGKSLCFNLPVLDGLLAAVPTPR